MSNPPGGSTLQSSTVTFQWTSINGASAYWLDVGTVLGQGNIFGQNVGLVTSQTVNNIPTSGQTIYVQLWTLINGAWNLNRYSYTAAIPIPAVMSSPTPGSTLTGSSVAFTWTSGTGASAIGWTWAQGWDKATSLVRTLGW